MIKSVQVSKCVYLLIVAMVCSITCDAQGQLFGNRDLGAPSGSQLRSPFGSGSGGRVAVPASPGIGGSGIGGPNGGQAMPGGAGLLDGNERFLRGNRSRQDFVGTGRNELSGFVGSGQAIGVGRVPAASESFRLEAMSAARVNKPVPKLPAKGPYYPRLVLDLQNDSDAIAGASKPRSLENDSLASLQRRVTNAVGAGVEVSFVDRKAVLRGTVDSKRKAELAASLLSFEPNVDSVDNQLTVRQ